MKSRLAMLAAIVVSILTFRAGAEPGGWEGSIELPGGIQLAFSVMLTDEGGTISIPAQNAKDVALTEVSTRDHALKFTLAIPGAPESAYAKFDLKVSDDGGAAEGKLHQSGGEFPVKVKKLAAGSAPKGMNRPQEPKGPFDYTITDVTFQNAKAGVTLAGTLVTPKGAGPHPAVVMITGSGAQDRDEALLGHRPFWIIADHLVKNGIAVLRFDDRGVAKSTGSFATATSDDFATDALAGVEFLKTLKEINPKKIGLIGHSEGGLIAPICASSSKDVAFIVLLAGTGVPGTEILPLQGKLIAMAMGQPEAKAAESAALTEKLLKMIVAGKPESEVSKRVEEATRQELLETPEGKAMTPEAVDAKVREVAAGQLAQVTSPWFKRFLALDPHDYLSKTTCPVLALNGTKDLQVPPEQNLPEIEKALKAGGNKDVTITRLEGLNHLFQHCTTGAPAEYSQIEETFAPEALDAMTVWIRARAGLH